MPAGLTAGLTYARFRLGYTATQVQSPTGKADSGEVEDYAVNLVAHPLNLAKTAGVLSGPNATGDYTATYAVTVTNSSTPATTYGPITDTPSFNSNLTVTGASWTGQSTGSATGAGPFTIGAASTSIPANTTHTYNVTVTFRYTGTGTATACGVAGTGLFNAASLPSPQETGVTTDNSACVAAPPKPASAITLDKQACCAIGEHGRVHDRLLLHRHQLRHRALDRCGRLRPQGRNCLLPGVDAGGRCSDDVHEVLHVDPGGC